MFIDALHGEEPLGLHETPEDGLIGEKLQKLNATIFCFDLYSL